MKWNKEIIAIIASLLLLAALIVNWGYNVYQNKITALQAETNIIFFEALEAAKETMYARKTIRPRLITTSDGVVRWGDYKGINKERILEFDVSDSIKSNEVDSDPNLFPSSFVRKELASFESSSDSASINVESGEALESLFFEFFKNGAKIGNDSLNISSLSISMTDDGGEIHMNSDTIIIVDFDTTHTYLEHVFLNKMDTAALSQLKIKVYDLEDLDAQEVKATFTTAPGKLGDVFFGRKTYAATVQNFAPIALRKMVPELLFGVFLFGLISTAFLIIYRNLLDQRKLVRIKDEFVGNITHELKTPISVVNVAIEAIQDFDVDKDPVKTKRYLDISKIELKRLSGLVDKVLHLSVNPSDDAPTELIDISEVTSQVVDAMRVRLNDSPIAIVLDVVDKDVMLQANISQIKSVIYNLIDNAIKYSNNGELKIAVHKTSSNWVEVKVADNGIGIPKSYQDKIYDQFFRVPSNNVHNVKGFGLGLHNVKQIVEQYGGTITLKSEEGKGSLFTIKWPITHAA